MSAGEVIISVVMPNYNKGEQAREAVQSFAAQPFPGKELIFTDDGSEDGSGEAVRAMAETLPCVKYIALPENSGGGAARNAGVRQASGEFLLFMDSDDLMAPDVLGTTVEKALAAEDCDFITFPMGLFHRTPGDSDRLIGLPDARPPLPRFLRRDHPWLISSPLWRKSFFEKIGGFDESLTSQQDYDLHVRALIAGARFRQFETPVSVYYRQDTESIPRAVSQSLDSLQMRAALIKRHLEAMTRAGVRNTETDRAVAAQLLDLAQMLRWHKNTLRHTSAPEGLRIWMAAHEYKLISPEEYGVGMGYIRFKHNMLWNRMPRMQRNAELRFRKKLGDLLPELSPRKSVTRA